MNDKVKQLAPQILEQIKKANNILLHCHPGMDGDSVGSSLAMMHYLKSLGKNVLVIAGDDLEVPSYLKVLPGGEQIALKNYLAIDSTEFDLFIINDSSSVDRVSRLGEVKFPSNMRIVVIDHHTSNTGFGDINLTLPETISTCEIYVSLFNEWGFEITKDIADCLFLGLYTDSGGFKYKGVTENTFKAAGQLANKSQNFPRIIFQMENDYSPEEILFTGLALSNVENYFNKRVAISAISLEKFKKANINPKNVSGSNISSTLRSVVGWDIGICMREDEQDMIYLSMRTRDEEKFDVSKIAMALGGGGHKSAAGASIKKPFNEAKQLLLETIQKVYPELGKP